MDRLVLPDNLTLIIADAPPLAGLRQRAQQLALRFAGILAAGDRERGSVWYFDEPGNLLTVFISPEKPLANLWSWLSGPRVTPGGIRRFIPPASLPFAYHSASINRWNHLWYRIALGSRFRPSEGPVVLIVCNVLGLGWLGRLGEDVAIYDCADEISQFRQARVSPGAVRAQERALLKRVDAVVTTSQGLYDAKSAYARRAVLIRNAAEIEHFARAHTPTARPPDIANLKKPIVGFYGFLADWLDWPLIKMVVREGKEFDWVFIGPATRSLRSLEKLPNFHALGRKPYEELPAYLAHFSCAHIPFARTKLTKYVNPVKLYEYLAAGVPVVATPLPELQAFEDVCALAETADDYLEAVRHEVFSYSAERRAERLARVAGETWDARVGEYCGLIRELVG